MADTSRAYQGFAGIPNKPSDGGEKRDPYSLLNQQVSWKHPQQKGPPHARRSQQKRRQQNCIRRPERADGCFRGSKEKADLRTQIVADGDHQSDERGVEKRVEGQGGMPKTFNRSIGGAPKPREGKDWCAGYHCLLPSRVMKSASTVANPDIAYNSATLKTTLRSTLKIQAQMPRTNNPVMLMLGTVRQRRLKPSKSPA